VFLLSTTTINAISHGHTHIRIPDVEYIKQQLIKQGSMMRGEELDIYSKEKYDELYEHIHSTHAHDHKYGQINSMKSPLPRPKPPKPYKVKDLDAAHTFTIRRSFNLQDINKDGVLSKEEIGLHLERNLKDINAKALKELLIRKENANLNPPRYMYVPRKSFKEGQKALIDAQLNNMKKAHKRIAEFLAKNPNRTEWSTKMQEGFKRVNAGIQQQSYVLNMDKRYQKLIDKGEGDTDIAKKLLQNITKRNLHLHPYENHKVTDEDPGKEHRVQRAIIHHEHSPEKRKNDGGHDMIEMLPHDDGQSAANAENLAENAKNDLKKVLKRKDELFNMQDVNRDGKIDFKEYYWRLKRQKTQQYEELKEEQRRVLAEPRKNGFFTEHGFWIPANKQHENDAQAIAAKEAQEKEREAILSQWEEEL
jgi:Ca2+-binding EF-hand superfamily protein